jgi:hypothetical protein
MPGKKGKEMLLLAASNGSDAGIYFALSDITSGRVAGTAAWKWC